MFSWTAEPMTAQGPRKGEPSLLSMRNGFRPQPARLVRGSSRRIMSMRFRPANIRVINRRDSYSAVIGSAVQTPTAQGSPTGTCSRYAARRRYPNARTVLTGQGSASPRQKAARPCLLRAVPAKNITRRAAPAGTLHGCRPWANKERLASLLTEESQPEFRSSNCRTP